MYGVVLVPVVHVVVEILVEGHGLQFAVFFGQGDDLVFRELHGSGLMHVDMSRTDADDAFILVEHRVDGRCIGLSTACQEENLSIGQAAGFANACLRTITEFVEAIGCWLGAVVLHEVVNYLLTSSVVVVAFE